MKLILAGNIENFHCQRYSVNIAMIAFVDLPLYVRELVGDFGGK